MKLQPAHNVRLLLMVYKLLLMIQIQQGGKISSKCEHNKARKKEIKLVQVATKRRYCWVLAQDKWIEIWLYIIQSYLLYKWKITKQLS